jgi:hypothetical protein
LAPAATCGCTVANGVTSARSAIDAFRHRWNTIDETREPIRRENHAGSVRMRKTYRGSCHCGAVTFEADLDLTQPSYRCNCSICRRTRFWPAVAMPEAFRLLTGEAALVEYLFRSRRNKHYFCRHCGVRPFGIGTDTPVGAMYGVNIGCLDDVSEATLAAIPITCVDGLHDRFEPPEYTAHL